VLATIKKFDNNEEYKDLDEDEFLDLLSNKKKFTFIEAVNKRGVKISKDEIASILASYSKYYKNGRAYAHEELGVSADDNVLSGNPTLVKAYRSPARESLFDSIVASKIIEERLEEQKMATTGKSVIDYVKNNDSSSLSDFRADKLYSKDEMIKVVTGQNPKETIAELENYKKLNNFIVGSVSSKNGIGDFGEAVGHMRNMISKGYRSDELGEFDLIAKTGA